MTIAIGPVPTPNPPQGVSYTPQLPGGQIYDDQTNVITNPNSPYNLPGGAPLPTYTPQNTYINTPVSNTTQSTPTPTTNNNNPPSNNNGGVPGVDMKYYAGWTDQNAINADWANTWQQKTNQNSGGSSIDEQQNAVRNQLSSAWDSYFSNLDQQFNGLEGQAGNMNQIVDNNYNQGVSDINTEKANNLGDLATSSRKNNENQVKSLADIADNIRNLFRSGNIYLGARGAGDSSAANQYSYATAKLGSKQRGGVLEQTRSIENDIEDRKAKLNNLVTQEMTKIKTERDNNVLQTAQWLSEAQNSLRQMRANGELQKGQSLAQLSQNLLDEAKNKLMQEDTRAKNRQDALQTWAMNNATTINQLKTNLQSVGQMNVASPTYDKISGAPTVDTQGNINTNFYGGAGSTASTTEDKSYLNNYLTSLWANK